MNNTIITKNYLNTLSQVIQYVDGIYKNPYADEEENNQVMISIVREAEDNDISGHMVIDMMKDYHHVRIAKMLLSDFYEKWEISEELFFELRRR